MNLFRRNRRNQNLQVSAPTLGEITFPGTNIVIRASPNYPSYYGNFMLTAMRHLEEIYAKPVGPPFFAALMASGKRQVIKYNGQNDNSCRCVMSGCVMLRFRYEQAAGAPTVEFAQELTNSLQRSGHNVAWLAAQLIANPLPNWQGGTTPPSWLPVGQPFMREAAVQAKVRAWLAGTELPDNEQMDGILLALRTSANALQAGPGANALITYDPNKTQSGGQFRPPHAALFHELVHAYYTARGEQLGREDSQRVDVGGRFFELMSVGLPPFHTAPYSENVFRAQWPCGPRNQYP